MVRVGARPGLLSRGVGRPPCTTPAPRTDRSPSRSRIDGAGCIPSRARSVRPCEGRKTAKRRRQVRLRATQRTSDADRCPGGLPWPGSRCCPCTQIARVPCPAEGAGRPTTRTSRTCMQPTRRAFQQATTYRRGGARSWHCVGQGSAGGGSQRRYREAFAALVVLVVPGALPGLALFAVIRSVAALRSRSREGRCTATGNAPVSRGGDPEAG